jgi:hypothetical protein
MRTLFRAFVALPGRLCLDGNKYQERTVFFEAEWIGRHGSHEPAGKALEALLSLAWGVDTTDWCEDGCIYNVTRERDLLDRALGDGLSRLLETGWGGTPSIHYSQRADVDMFVSPLNRARLDAAFEQIAAQAVAA